MVFDVLRGSGTLSEKFFTLVVMLAALFISLSVHELCHGLGAYFMGDRTPRYDGRLSLNPLQHMDPVGTICLLFFGFGWAKPVRVNPMNFKYPKFGMALTAFSGPLSNFILGLLAFIGYFYFQINRPDFIYMVSFFQMLLSFNVGLMVFNLIPIPPLDGSKVLGAVLPKRWYYGLMQFERYGFIVLLLLINLPVFDWILDGAYGLVLSGYSAIVLPLLF